MSPTKQLVLFVVLLAVSGATPGWSQPAAAAMVADLNQTQEDFVTPLLTYPGFVPLGTEVLFVHDDGIHGFELWKTDGTTAGTILVKDICPGACWSWISVGVVWHGVFYFGANDGVHGRELWRSDGTAAGTFMVRDINPGISDSYGSLRVAGGTLYLAADDGVHGQELWRTDGTAAGTQLIADINPGPAGSQPHLWLDVGGKLLLNADDGVHGREPWLSDGTAAGTALLKDVNPGPGSSSYSSGLFEKDAVTLSGGGFIFQADDGTHGAEPWISDGTRAGTILLKDINPGNGSSQATGFAPLASRVLFRAYDDTNGWELWVTDGTEAGTVLVKAIKPPYGSYPFQLTPFGGAIYFEASDATTGRELWRTDGTAAGTVLVKDINPGAKDAFTYFYLYDLTLMANALYFFADDGVHGPELWRSDGTAAGTALVKDINPGGLGSFGLGFSRMATVNGRLFFHAFNPDGYEPWVSDGTAAGTVELKNISHLTSSLQVESESLGGPIQDLGGGRLLFAADDGITGVEPWVTDGTETGTRQLADLTPGRLGSYFELFRSGGLTLLAGPGLWTTDGTPAGTVSLLPAGTLTAAQNLTAALDKVFFLGTDTLGTLVWKTDGTTDGTFRIYSGTPSNSQLTPVGSAVLFTASDWRGEELWRTDGTSAGTFLLADIRPGDQGSYPSWITPLGSVAIFTADDGTTGQELYVTDATQAGTLRLKDIRPGAASSDPFDLRRLGNLVFFVADDGATGRELWRTDGTPAGTVLVKDILPGAGSSFPRYPFTLQVMGNAVYFVADDGVSGAELWKSDGTAAGTVRVRDIRPGPASADIEAITVAGNRLFFVADDGIHGRELWVSDGTAAGTRMAKDAVPGPGSPVIQQLTALGHLVLFSADDGIHGRELWRSNGSPAGTFQVQDLAPGPAPSSPLGFTASGDGVYFGANDNVAGFELWRVPKATLLTTFSDVPPTYWSWRFIEALSSAALTSGCGNGRFCPAQPVTRAEAAVFLIGAEHGPGYTPPPATGARFTDVPADSWAAPWIEQIAAEGITGGCGNGKFCPDTLIARAEMAVLLLGAEHGSSYSPPPATGTRFTDVPATYWAARFIEQLAAEGITGGCGNGRFCPAATVSRAELAVFLAAGFHLPLP